MIKKIGISLLLAFTMLVSIFNVGTITTAYARACTTIPECREIQRMTRDNIAGFLEEEEELSEEIAVVQAKITDLRSQVSDLEDTISVRKSEIAILTAELADLAEEVENNLEVLYETEARTEVLVDEISQRMRITQRVNNTNSFLAILSESTNLTDFLRVTRTFSRIALEDAELMEELNDLIEFQENLLIELAEQRDQIESSRIERQTRVAELEEKQANLREFQNELVKNETQLQDALAQLYEDRTSEEELLAMAIEMQEILERTPPPQVTTPISPSGVQTPNASGLAHPMPGSRVTSEFGPRWGTHHSGIDLVVDGNPSAAILSAAAGTVTLAGWNDSMGWWVIISHNINDQRVDTVYAHLRYSPPISAGEVVSQGQVIGTKGNTGNSFGAHLHFEVHPGGFAWGSPRGVNPRQWVSFN